MAGEKGFITNKYYPSVVNECTFDKHRSEVEEKSKAFFPDDPADQIILQIDLMMMQLAISSNCPYSIESLEEMHFEDLFKVRDRVHYLDAIKAATELDYKQHNENQQPSR